MRALSVWNQWVLILVKHFTKRPVCLSDAPKNFFSRHVVSVHGVTFLFASRF